MPIRVFPPHYQLVYINFDISSFSLISYPPTSVSSRAHIRTLTMVRSSSRDNRRSDQEKRFQSIPFHRCNSKVKPSKISV